MVITFPLLIANAEIGQLDMPRNSDDLWLGASPLLIIEFEEHALCSVSLLRTRLSTSYRFEFKVTALIVSDFSLESSLYIYRYYCTRIK